MSSTTTCYPGIGSTLIQQRSRNGPKKNGEDEMYRMKDALASTILEDSYGLQIAEWGFMPHDFYFMNMRFSQGLGHPDDVRSMHMSTMNRRSRYVEHYVHVPGDKQRHMTLPM